MIGTIALFRPKMGMKMKLWSLKNAPNTAVAASVKEMRILFMPNTITEPMDCMMMDGTPTA